MELRIQFDEIGDTYKEIIYKSRRALLLLATSYLIKGAHISLARANQKKWVLTIKEK